MVCGRSRAVASAAPAAAPSAPGSPPPPDPASQEGVYFDRALQTPVHRALASAFFAHRAMKKARNPAQWLVRWLYALWTRVVALATLAWEWWRPVPSSEPARKTD